MFHIKKLLRNPDTGNWYVSFIHDDKTSEVEIEFRKKSDSEDFEVAVNGESVKTLPIKG